MAIACTYTNTIQVLDSEKPFYSFGGAPLASPVYITILSVTVAYIQTLITTQVFV